MDLHFIDSIFENSRIFPLVPGLKDALMELRVLSDMVVNDKLMNLLDPTFRQNHFQRLTPANLATLLEKYKEVKGKKPGRRAVVSIAKKLKPT